MTLWQCNIKCKHGPALFMHSEYLLLIVFIKCSSFPKLHKFLFFALSSLSYGVSLDLHISLKNLSKFFLLLCILYCESIRDLKFNLSQAKTKAKNFILIYDSKWLNHVKSQYLVSI